MRETVYSTLCETGLPVAHMAFEKGKVPPLPWLVYIQGESRGMYADNGIYRSVSEFSVELYQMPTSRDVEKKVEEAISKLGMWSREEEIWIESEGCIETVYHFTMIEKETE